MKGLAIAAMLFGFGANIALGQVVVSPPPTAANLFIAPTEWDRPLNTTEATADHTTYQEWYLFNNNPMAGQFFEVAGSPTRTYYTPTIASVNPNGTATVSEAKGRKSSILSNNLYNSSLDNSDPATFYKMEVTVPGAAEPDATSTKFRVQIYSYGNSFFKANGLYGDVAPPDTNGLGVNPIENDFSRFFINDTLISSLDSFDYQHIISERGSNDTSLFNRRAFEFELPGNLSSYTISFEAARNSTGLRGISVDTYAAVPEPATFALLGLGGAALGLRRRRR